MNLVVSGSVYWLQDTNCNFPKSTFLAYQNMTKCSKYGGDYFVNEVDPTYVSPIKSVLAKPTEFKLSIYIRVRDKW